MDLLYGDTGILGARDAGAAFLCRTLPHEIQGNRARAAGVVPRPTKGQNIQPLLAPPALRGAMMARSCAPLFSWLHHSQAKTKNKKRGKKS